MRMHKAVITEMPCLYLRKYLTAFLEYFKKYHIYHITLNFWTFNFEPLNLLLAFVDFQCYITLPLPYYMSVVILCLKIFIFASTLLLMLLGAFFSISAAVMDVRANVGIYLFKVNNRNTRAGCEIYSKLTIKTPEPRLASLRSLYC